MSKKCDISGVEIKIGDYFVASRKAGNVHELRFGYIVATSPAIKTRMWLQCIGTLKQPDSILVIPETMVPTLYLEYLHDRREEDLHE